MKGIIYKATDNWNGKVYIGQTIGGLKARMTRHISDAQRDSDNNAFHFALSLRNYDFKWEVIDTFEGDADFVHHALNVAEEYHILKYRSAEEEYGYNSTYGGYSSDKFSKGYLTQMRDFGKGSKPRAYWQYDLDGNFIQEFNSLRAIAAHFDLRRMRGDVLKEDGQWHGYQWRAKRGNKPYPKIGEYEAPVGHSIRVLQYSLDGEYMSMHSSISAASASSGDTEVMINLLCSGGIPMKKPHFQWRTYSDDYPLNIGPIKLRPKKGDAVKKLAKIEHRVLQYTLRGEFVGIHDNITKASDASGDSYCIIRSQCLGKLVRVAKFQWRYYTEDFPKQIAPIRFIEKKTRVPKHGAIGRPRKITSSAGQATLF